MKQYKILYVALLATFTIGVNHTKAQDINWVNVRDGNQHFAGLNFGADYSSYYGVSYAYSIKNKLAPTVVGFEFNVPFGKDVLDDWYLRAGIQSNLWSNNHLELTLQAAFITRRFESEIASLLNLGADVTTLFGYSKPRWGILAEVNYDRSISANIQNKVLMEYYPEIQDGWYNSGGGNFKLGVRANVTIKSYNIFLHIGKTYGQNFQDNPTLPFYFKLSLNKAF